MVFEVDKMPDSLKDICESRDKVSMVLDRFQECWSEIEASSSLTIGPLSNTGWERLLKILALTEVDLSRIEHLVWQLSEIETPIYLDVTIWKYQILVLGINELVDVLESGRFLMLKTLKIIGELAELSWEQSKSVAAAFARGQFENLQALTLPACSVTPILGALIEGHMCQLSSISIIFSGHRHTAENNFNQQLDAVFKSGCFKNLRHLGIYNWAVDKPHAHDWDILTKGLNSGLVPNFETLGLVNSGLQGVDLAKLVPMLVSGSLENLTMSNCCIISDQICVTIDGVMKAGRAHLALKRLDLSNNGLGPMAVEALVLLASSGLLLNLQVLDLSRNREMVPKDLEGLTETIKRGHLPLLQTLDWGGNRISDSAAEAIAQAYLENQQITTHFKIAWFGVKDISLKTKATNYRDRNLRLVALKEQHKEELREVAPLTCAKVFLCGYPEVGKTKLRKTLCRPLRRRTKLHWETHPTVFKEPRTRGIELSRIEEIRANGDTMALVLWDLAGQDEFHVLHCSFMADLGLEGGKATTFVLVFRSPFEKDTESKLMYWLRFVAASSLKHVKRHVVIVLNCFNGQQCTENDKRLWMALIKSFKTSFNDLLDVYPDPVIVDARVASSVKLLKDHLFDYAHRLLQGVRVPRICLVLQEELKVWSKGDKGSHLPILSWEAFEKGLSRTYHKNAFSRKASKAGASYLHEIGELIYFKQELADSGREGNSIVVPNPEWFCRRVVGQLLLPKDMLKKGESAIMNEDGSIPTILFQSYFEHLLVEGIQSSDVILMLERLGLCYRKGTEQIVVPTLIREDKGIFDRSLEWEGKGIHWVMGRCLATEDKERGVIPLTLFRQLQVELALDPNFGGRTDSRYRVGKSYSNFRVGELRVLVQFDVDHSDPKGDRVDILVKSVTIQHPPAGVNKALLECICAIQEKLEILCVGCCPGLNYDIKVINPWGAATKTPKMINRELMSLREMKDLVMKGHRYLGWYLDKNALELKTFFHDLEWQSMETKATPSEEIAEQEYDECKRDAVSLGLLTEDSLQSFKGSEEEDNLNTVNLAMEVSTVENLSDDHLLRLSNKIYSAIQELKEIVRGEAHHTRQHVDKRSKELLLETRLKHGLLVKLIQSQQSFLIEEKELSVPRYLFLAQRRGKSRVWISLREGFQSSFTLHLLCEAHFDDGFLHEVQGQEGIELKKTREWLEKISPWLRRSLQVALAVTKIVGNVYLPGLPALLPHNILPNDKASAKAVDTAATMLLDDGQETNQVIDGHRGYGTAAEPVKLNERLIAQEVLKDLISELGHAVFAKKIGLRKVLLRAAIQPSIGSSEQNQPSVVWICDECFQQYGDRAVDISPRV